MLFRSYESQVANKKEAYLGYLGWYTLSGVKIKHEDLIAFLNKRNLNIVAPSVPQDVDIFRRISSNAELRKVPTSLEGTFQNYLVRSTDERDPDTIRRLIVCETVDKKGKRLSYEEVYYIDFKRIDSSIQFGPVNTSVSPELNFFGNKICQEIVSDFQSWQGCLNSQSIREMIRRALLRFGATKVRDGGGVYFVSNSQTSNLNSLELFVNEDLGGNSNFHSLPLVDDNKQRDMIRRAFEAETTEAVDAILAEIQELSKSKRPISSNRYANLITEYQELCKKSSDYSALLENALGETDSRITIVQSALIGLRNNVRD